MINRNIYLLMIGLLLLGVTACSKKPNNAPKTGNVTVNPNGKDVPAGTADGVTFSNGGKSAIFNLYAPGKTSVTLLGDFNNWTASPAYVMNNSTDGNRWWIQVDNLDPNAEYAYEYFIDGKLKVADPYSTKVLDSANDKYIPTSVYPGIKAYPSGAGEVNHIVSDIQYSAPAYTWKTTSFTRAAPKNLVVYELLPRDFVATHSYQTLTDTLSYMANLGVNAIELMPVNEFEGNDSWGYNSNFMFALDKYYGTPNAYKAFIDACHAKGIAVIQDIVLEDQFGSSPMVQMYWNASAGAPASNSPWFDVSNMHPDAVGYQMNHQSAATQYFTKNVMKYWMQEYKIDGFRFDEAKGYTQTPSADEATWANYDAARVATWESYNTYMKGIDPNFYVILEMFAGSQEQSVLGSQGMMMWNNMSGAGEQSTMGFPSGPSWDLSPLFYDSDGMSTPYSLIDYFESHDEERLQFKNEAYGNGAGTYSTKDIPTGLKRDEMAAVFMFSAPGPKMLWQFGERGYDISINDLGGRLSDKPPHWEYMSDANRHHLYQVYSRMIKWKIKNPVFTAVKPNFSYNLGGYVKTIQLVDASNKVEVIGNFDVNPEPVTITFPASGTWYDNITGTSITSATTSYGFNLAPGEYHLYSQTPLN